MSGGKTKAPPVIRTQGVADVPMPKSPVLEKLVTPSKKAIAGAVKELI